MMEDRRRQLPYVCLAFAISELLRDSIREQHLWSCVYLSAKAETAYDAYADKSRYACPPSSFKCGVKCHPSQRLEKRV